MNYTCVFNNQPRTIRTWNQHGGKVYLMKYPCLWPLRIPDEGFPVFRDSWVQTGFGKAHALPGTRTCRTVARWKWLQGLSSELSRETGTYKTSWLAVDNISPCQQLLISWRSIRFPILMGAKLLLHPWRLSFGKLLTLDFNSSETVSLLPQISEWNDFPASARLAAFLS